MNIKPLHDRILVRRDKKAEKTSGGILLPDNAAGKPQRGTVVAAGPGRVEGGELLAMCVKPGDKIIFPQYSGNHVEGAPSEEGELLIMSEGEVLAVVVD